MTSRHDHVVVRRPRDVPSGISLYSFISRVMTRRVPPPATRRDAFRAKRRRRSNPFFVSGTSSPAPRSSSDGRVRFVDDFLRLVTSANDARRTSVEVFVRGAPSSSPGDPDRRTTDGRTDGRTDNYRAAVP